MKKFTENKADNNDFQKNIVKSVENHKNSCINKKQPNCDINFHDVEKAIKENRATKCLGYDNSSAYMIKHCKSTRLIELITKLFREIINTNKTPENFNTSIIRPILKDKSKDNGDITNIRPISISNPVAQLFERLLLNKIKHKIETSVNQFGFKKQVIMQSSDFCY